MIRTLPFVLLAMPAAAQQTVGTVTATVDAEERTYVVFEPDGAPSAGFERQDGVIEVRIVARPDRTPVEETPVLELRFLVTGMGPTAEVSEAAVRYTGPDGETLSTAGGTAEVSLTAFEMEEAAITAAGNFASQLHAEPGGMAELAIEGDFQTSIRETEFADVE